MVLDSIIQSPLHPVFGCVTQFIEWFCVPFPPCPLNFSSPNPQGRPDTAATVTIKSSLK